VTLLSASDDGPVQRLGKATARAPRSLSRFLAGYHLRDALAPETDEPFTRRPPQPKPALVWKDEWLRDLSQQHEAATSG